MALKDMKYCFRPLASDLASLVKLHFARMVLWQCKIIWATKCIQFIFIFTLRVRGGVFQLTAEGKGI